MPCAARLTVLAVLTPFFLARTMWVSLGLVALSLAFAGSHRRRLHELGIGRRACGFYHRLALHHPPHPRSIAPGCGSRSPTSYEAGGVILIVYRWRLGSRPPGRGGIEASYPASIGRALTPLSGADGLNWQMVVALLTSFVRKENTIATLAVLYGATQGGAGLGAALQAAMTPAAALAFLTAQMLFIPCVATVATIRQETNSWRWTIASVILLLAVSLAMGMLVYQIAVRF